MSATSECLLDALEREKATLRRFLSLNAVPTFKDTYKSLEIVLSVNTVVENPATPLLNFIETYCNVAKKRIFSSIDIEGAMFDISELDHLEIELDAMASLGHRFPSMDIDIMAIFVDLVCEISCYYVKMLEGTLERFTQQDRFSEEVIFKKIAFFEHLRVSAFRLRYFCLSIIDMISLQDSFNICNSDYLKILENIVVKYDPVCLTFQDAPQIQIFVTRKLFEDATILDRFMKSNVDTSDELVSEFIIVCRALEETPFPIMSVLEDNHPLRRFIQLPAKSDVHVLTKSAIRLRQIRREFLKDGVYTSTRSDEAGFRNCVAGGSSSNDSRRSFVCLRDIIVQSQADICKKITDFLMDITYEDYLTFNKYQLLDRFDRSSLAAVSFAFQFLFDATELTDAVERTYVDLVSRSIYWLNFDLGLYIDNVNRRWFASYIILHLENLNAIFTQSIFKPLPQWKDNLAKFKELLEKVKSLPMDQSEIVANSYIIDQGDHLRELWGGESVPKRIRRSSSSPDEEVLNRYDYTIVSSFGASPYFKCLDLRTRKLVAVKRLPKSPEQSPEATRSEIEIIMALKHPNIVQYLNSFETDKEMFLVMEYCESKLEIYAGVENPSPVPENHVQSIGRQILKGLAYLHANHLIHRDIKPSNILLTGPGFVKIADFGDARIMYDTTSKMKFDMGSLSGTPQYMAPECLHQCNVTSYADIWSFGCVLVYLLTARDPWQECDNKFNVLYKLGSSEELPIDIAGISCSEAAKNILRAIFVREPAQRPKAIELLNMDYFSKVDDSII